LSEPERLLLNRLSVFVGGWSLEAAEGVCSDEHIAPEHVLDLLAQLVSKSLVLADEDADGIERYRLLETGSSIRAGAIGRGRRSRIRAPTFCGVFPGVW
jgi:predicted ATPase